MQAEKISDGEMPKYADANPNICPTCGDEFDGVQGVTSHHHSHGEPVNPAWRLWTRVRSGDHDECWEWFGGGSGYGSIQIDGSKMAPSRAVMLLQGIELDTDDFVCHNCDNPPCCNPAHLYVGDHNSNMRDAAGPNEVPEQNTMMQTEKIPDDETLREMDDGVLSELGADVMGEEYVGSSRRTRANLRKIRDGGIPMACSGCDYHWVYAMDETDAPQYITCPSCYSKLSVNANRQDNG